MSAHPGLVSKVSAALARADRGPLEVSYDTLAAAAVDAVCAWIAEGGQGG